MARMSPADSTAARKRAEAQARNARADSLKAITGWQPPGKPKKKPTWNPFKRIFQALGGK